MCIYIYIYAYTYVYIIIRYEHHENVSGRRWGPFGHQLPKGESPIGDQKPIPLSTATLGVGLIGDSIVCGGNSPLKTKSRLGATSRTVQGLASQVGRA